MELTKVDKAQLKSIIRSGILKRCEEWLRDTQALIGKEYDNQENAFDRCMEVTRRSKNFYKEACAREDYYSNAMLLPGAGVLLAEGYISDADIAGCREELQAAIRLFAGVHAKE